MTFTRPSARATPDAFALAAAARSIVSCPGSVDFSVAGVGHGEPPLTLRDDDGVPVLVCRADSPLSRAGLAGRHTVVRLGSGLGRPGDLQRGDRVSLGGRLQLRGRQSCPCCEEDRDEVALLLDDVVVCVADARGSGVPRAVPLAAYADPAHRLNRGYLQRCADHAVHCHEPELRAAVAASTGSQVTEIGGVHLDDLTVGGVSLSWVDHQGGHSRRIDFHRVATDCDELSLLLRAELHLGEC